MDEIKLFDQPESRQELLDIQLLDIIKNGYKKDITKKVNELIKDGADVNGCNGEILFQAYIHYAHYDYGNLFYNLNEIVPLDNNSKQFKDGAMKVLESLFNNGADVDKIGADGEGIEMSNNTKKIFQSVFNNIIDFQEGIDNFIKYNEHIFARYEKSLIEKDLKQNNEQEIDCELLQSAKEKLLKSRNSSSRSMKL